MASFSQPWQNNVPKDKMILQTAIQSSINHFLECMQADSTENQTELHLHKICFVYIQRENQLILDLKCRLILKCSLKKRKNIY